MPLRNKESGRGKLVFTILIGAVLVFSIIGFTFSAIPFGVVADNNRKYGDVELVPTTGGLAASIGGRIFQFTYYPEDIISTDVSTATSRLKAARVAYATSEERSFLASQITGAEFDINRAMDLKYNSFLDMGFTGPNTFNRTVITCRDATPVVPVIYFNFTNTTTGITEEGNCVIINFASAASLEKVRDNIIYELLGVNP